MTRWAKSQTVRPSSRGVGMKENVVLQCERSRAWATMATREKKGRSEGKKC